MFCNVTHTVSSEHNLRVQSCYYLLWFPETEVCSQTLSSLWASDLIWLWGSQSLASSHVFILSGFQIKAKAFWPNTDAAFLPEASRLELMVQIVWTHVHRRRVGNYVLSRFPRERQQIYNYIKQIFSMKIISWFSRFSLNPLTSLDGLTSRPWTFSPFL